ncbi:MAG TPA: tRNA (uridine(34)/cytosine(34)/5-carboxymethylaminomethyluridine(34)-2'-O)-methyltransferase TrmL [Burkholderiaceae bacterium]|jgi:tRNA (cytidine/uridine-2'-O-)-methyltransferase|nr:tRNA (uridine(34)/cytosine(34)/5-carboxymethylaminomethyluridine(34)-2'-O)-methyltransferase TrmL [Burkholderiaceae bacterium]
MFNVVLVEPQIPPNTGNVIRLCANTGARLHLVQPLGFALDHARMRRAGLDYHEFAQIALHASFEALLRSEHPELARAFALTRHGSAHFAEVEFRAGDWFVFGSETEGLPLSVRAHFPAGRQLRLPMRPGNRSLNLSNAVAVVVFEAWRQSGFSGGV